MIGLFDSGIGGLTVLKSLREKHPQKNYVYLGRYGSPPLRHQVSRNHSSLPYKTLNFSKKQGVSSVISACHSASSSILIYNIQDPSVPVYNVIEPACQKAMAYTKNKKMALIATQATVDSGQYKN